MNNLYKIVLLILLSMQIEVSGQNCLSIIETPQQLTITDDLGNKFRIQFFAHDIFRFSAIPKGQSFLPDNRYEMVEKYDTSASYKLRDDSKKIIIETQATIIEINKRPLKMKISDRSDKRILLEAKNGIEWSTHKVNASFVFDSTEHFCGMGHQAFGLVKSLDLRGNEVSCNYGDGITTEGIYGKQAVLTVPFYLSGKGYGIFLNSTFKHHFNFGKNLEYSFGIETFGELNELDFFFIYGPSIVGILDHYTELTGRPRLPQRSMFGLQLSDKGAPKNNGEQWWKAKIAEHRKAGFPFDHIVNDNRWRAGSGAWGGSWFKWDSLRYPDPAKYNNWVKANNVTLTLDLNRNVGAASWGWKPEYNLPYAEKFVKEGYSAPDYSNPETRKWLWNLFWKESFNPALNYPGDAIWMDETDELWTLPDTVICANGRSWAENRNYYQFLIAKAIVQEGWDNNEPGHQGIGEAKRPFVWVRSMSAGAQRYATLWTGDLHCDYNWMKMNIRAMQTSGLAGFPYFNHDAGGFRDPGPDDNMYVQWGMAFGSFSPIWRPHGEGSNQRWPLDRSGQCQTAAQKYATLRYELMPYIYTAAYNAHMVGMPMARAMIIDYQDNPLAWKFDLQYMWGGEMLVAPSCTNVDTTMDIWLPGGQKWYYFWNDSILKGNQVIKHQAKVGVLPLFIKEGAIIPTYNFALSTFQLDHSKLNLDIYCGKSGSYSLYEDDGVTEKFRTRHEFETQKIDYDEKARRIIIHAVSGRYSKAPSHKIYTITLHHVLKPGQCLINGTTINVVNKPENDVLNENTACYHKGNNILKIKTTSLNVNSEVVIEIK